MRSERTAGAADRDPQRRSLPRRTRRRFGRDEAGQMILLAALLLLVGMLALGTLSARLAGLPEASEEVGRQPTLEQAAALTRALERAIPELAADIPGGPDHLDAVDGVTRQLAAMATQQGHPTRLAAAQCAPSGSGVEVSVTATLEGQEGRIQWTVRVPFADGSC